MFSLGSSAYATWSVELARAGFMGKVSAGPIYEFTNRHALAFTIGSYQNGPGHYGQLNLAYRYAHWRFERPDFSWKPLHIGLFAIYSLDQDRFFTNSPKKYPSPGYYEETALRGGFELGTTIMHRKSGIGFATYLRILDNGIVALLNNTHRDLQYYSSSGFSFQYSF